ERPHHHQHLLRRARSAHRLHHVLRDGTARCDGLAAARLAAGVPRVSTFDPADLLRGHESRAVTFENPTGARGAGGTAHGGRKGAPNRRVRAGERVVLADIDGPGIVRHLWMTVPPAPPEPLRALPLEVFYDDATEPSVSVP